MVSENSIRFYLVLRKSKSRSNKMRTNEISRNYVERKRDEDFFCSRALVFMWIERMRKGEAIILRMFSQNSANTTLTTYIFMFRIAF